jgi:hypothetical protein
MQAGVAGVAQDTCTYIRRCTALPLIAVTGLCLTVSTLLEPSPKRTADKSRTAEHTQEAITGFVILPKDIGILDHSIDVNRDRTINQILFRWRSAECVSDIPQHIPARRGVGGDLHILDGLLGRSLRMWHSDEVEGR